MKANELMIGDWVCYDGDVEYCNPIRIEGMDSATNSCITSDRDDVGFDGVVPIPLTPEILEKNGFTHSFGDSDFYDYEKWEKKVDDKAIRVIKDHDGWFCRVNDNKLTRSMGIAPAVHTMQNIIRIGGIEKTIEL